MALFVIRPMRRTFILGSETIASDVSGAVTAGVRQSGPG
jgi:hypothetical protein